MNNIIGGIQFIDWDKNKERVYFSGYAFIEGCDLSKQYKVKKSLFIKNENKKYIMPSKDVLKLDISEKYCKDKSFNYDYAGFEGFFEVSTIDKMKPLAQGDWEIGIYINCGGIEQQAILKYIGTGEEIVGIEPKRLENHSKNYIKEIDLYLNGDDIKIRSKDQKVSTLEYIKFSIKNKTLKKYNDIFKKCKKNILKQKRKFGNYVLQKIYNLMKLKKTVPNRVVFLSDSRVDFSGNFEFIKRELDKRGGYDIKYILKPSIKAKRSLKEMINFVYYIATSRFILLDDYYPQIYKYKIKKDIDVIQLWHAAGAFKTFGFSRIGKKGGPNVKSKNHRNYTKAIVSSKNLKLQYAEAFGISESNIVSTGVPRTDIFFDEIYINKKTKDIYEKYPILKDKKVILFAPTFRGSGQKTATYDFFKFDIELLHENLGKDYVLITKLHPFINEKMDIPKECEDFVLDLSHEREINDLLFITDILITDYSSVCFEASLLNKPMIFFAYDLEEYIASRDFYYPYESFVPGPIARNTGEILRIIQEDNFDIQKLQEFKNTFFDHFDGKSTERVVDQLMKI